MFLYCGVCFYIVVCGVWCVTSHSDASILWCVVCDVTF